MILCTVSYTYALAFSNKPVHVNHNTYRTKSGCQTCVWYVVREENFCYMYRTVWESHLLVNMIVNPELCVILIMHISKPWDLSMGLKCLQFGIPEMWGKKFLLIPLLSGSPKDIPADRYASAICCFRIHLINKQM